jgi:hypothetical protein
VVQRRQVRELDRDGARDQARIAGVAEVPGQQDEHRPEPLAARLEQVPGGRREQIRVGDDRLLERLFDPVEAAADLRLQGGIGRFQPGDHTTHPFTTSRPMPSPGCR